MKTASIQNMDDENPRSYVHDVVGIDIIALNIVMCTFKYLAQVNKDGTGYPPNSVIVGMFEGYYSHPGVGGVCAT